MNKRVFQWIMIVLVVEMGLLHLYAAPGEFEETPIMGMLFIGNFLAALLAALDIYRQSTMGWVLSAFLSIGSIAGYILSRTIGLPGMEVEEWYNPIGIFSLVVEGIILILILWQQLWRRPEPQDNPIVSKSSVIDQPIWIRSILPVASLMTIILISLFAFEWDSHYVVEAQPMAHMMQISQSDLEQKYGLQVSLVGVSMMGSIVDVRFRVLDVEKAQQFLEDPGSMPGLMVATDRGTMIMPVHMHRHGMILKEGRYFILFFPNPQYMVQNGTPVVLTFGDLELDSVIAQ